MHFPMKVGDELFFNHGSLGIRFRVFVSVIFEKFRMVDHDNVNNFLILNMVK